MKLGFIAENHLEGIEADCRFCNEHGYEGLEFNYWGTFKDLTAETVADMRRTLDKHGVACSTLGMWGWNHISADPAEREAAHAQLERGIAFAQTLGAPTLITGGGNLAGATVEQNGAEFGRVMRPYVDRCTAAGLKVAIYGFHGGSFLDSITGYEAIWEHLPEVGIKYDPANIDHGGADYVAVAQKHGARIFHVHIKEHLNHAGQLIAQPAAGMGSIEWGKIFAFLHEHDYQGYLTMEPHGNLWSREPLRTKMLVLSKRHIEQFLV
ncbi:MAG: sugar phosphate isomerase/epimerase [Armatimonadetes bacterium]|nr:sugar phosphate isomerase/epimerase [Armatimonadota bacterium]